MTKPEQFVGSTLPAYNGKGPCRIVGSERDVLLRDPKTMQWTAGYMMAVSLVTNTIQRRWCRPSQFVTVR